MLNAKKNWRPPGQLGGRVSQVRAWPKILGGGCGLRKIFRGGRGQNFLKFFLQICENLVRSQNFSEKMEFFTPKSQKFLRKCKGRGYFKPPPLNSCMVRNPILDSSDTNANTNKVITSNPCWCTRAGVDVELLTTLRPTTVCQASVELRREAAEEEEVSATVRLCSKGNCRSNLLEGEGPEAGHLVGLQKNEFFNWKMYKIFSFLKRTVFC